MPLPAIGIGAATLAGSLITNFANAAGARSQARFQERMANTAHQRQVTDLRKAGINPLLGAGGAGASTPIGSRPQFEDSVGKSVSSALDAKTRQANLELLKAQTHNQFSQAERQNAEIFQMMSLLGPRENEINARTALLKIDEETKRKVVSFVAQHYNSEIARNLATAWQARSGAGLHEVESILKGLSVNQARNASQAEEDWFLRTMGPYLHSAGQFGGIIKAGAGVGFAAGRQMGEFSENFWNKFKKEKK